MRIVCHTLDDFLKNLRSTSVHRGVVHANIVSRPWGEERKDKATSFVVVFQASAVLEFPNDQGQALLAFGTETGIDRISQPQSTAGTNLACSLLNKLKMDCDDLGLTVMPGILDF